MRDLYSFQNNKTKETRRIDHIDYCNNYESETYNDESFVNGFIAMNFWQICSTLFLYYRDGIVSTTEVKTILYTELYFGMVKKSKITTDPKRIFLEIGCRLPEKSVNSPHRTGDRN